jgi:hypothetical protein
MKRLMLTVAGILLFASVCAFATDPGQQDSVIIDTISVPYNPVGVSATVKVWFVTDDSVMTVNFPITWDSQDGLVYPGRTVWRETFTEWSDVYDTLLIAERLLRQVAFAQTGSADSLVPPLMTNYVRLRAMDLRFVALPNAASQFVMIDTVYDPRNGSISFGGPRGDWDLTPAVRRGFFRYGTVGIGDGPTASLPTEFGLKQNYPNPFNPETNIQFMVPQGSNVSIEIFNILGQKVKKLVSEFKDAGIYSVRWDGANEDGQNVPSGVYFYKMVAGDFAQTNKMIMLR